MVDLRGKLPTHPMMKYGTRPVEGIQFLIIHHSAVAVDSTAEALARYHISPHGDPPEEYPGIAYTYLVHWDGVIEQCWDLDTQVWGIWGRNRECLSICLPGNWNGEEPPELQLRSTRYLVASLRRTLRWDVPVRGHGEAALPRHSTSCPGATFSQWRERIGA